MRAWTAALALFACRGNVADPEPVPLPPPEVHSTDADLLVPWSFVVVHGEGFLQRPAGTTVVRLEGSVDGRAAGVFLRPHQSSARQMQILVDPDFVALFEGRVGTFVGTAAVEVTPSEQPPVWSAPTPVRLDFAPALVPKLTSVAAEDVAPGAVLPLRGDGLLSGAEGRSALVLNGRFETHDGASFRVTDAELPVVERLGRTSGGAFLAPAALGLSGGTFEGHARLRTQAADGTLRDSGPLTLAFEQHGPRLDALAPLHAARGQVLTLSGSGFLPNEPAEETATLVRAEGVFSPTLGEPYPVSVALLPETWVDHTEVRLGLRTQLDDEGRPVGWGATAGVFEGTLTAELLAGGERASTAPMPLRFEFAPATQVVHLRYLRGFRDALATFGLAGAEGDLRTRVLQVCHRDYAGLRVHFTEQRPLDWAEFVTVEIGGRDPNGLGLFGLDNTPIKDDGNQRLDELLGGRNAEAEALGNLPFGGVFIESFLALSPSHPEASIIADARFDEVFGPFSTAVDEDAEPFEAGDAISPARASQLQIAVDALANLIGSTVSHEVGHALGLAAYGSQVHNPLPREGALMDAGSDRPFAERAAIDGRAPARFLGPNRTYLDRLFGDAP